MFFGDIISRILYSDLGHGSFVNSCDVSRRGQLKICSGSDDCTVKVWDPRQKAQLTTFNNTYQVTAVCFNDTADYVISAGIDNDIKVFILLYLKLLNMKLVLALIFEIFSIIFRKKFEFDSFEIILITKKVHRFHLIYSTDAYMFFNLAYGDFKVIVYTLRVYFIITRCFLKSNTSLKLHTYHVSGFY